MRPRAQKRGQRVEENHRLLRRVKMRKGRSKRVGRGVGGVSVCWRRVFVVPSKPGALAGPLAAQRISSCVNGAMRGSQMEGSMPLALYTCERWKNGGDLMGRGFGLQRILEASATSVFFRVMASVTFR